MVKHIAKIKHKKTCQFCGYTFETNADPDYCSKDCENQAKA